MSDTEDEESGSAQLPSVYSVTRDGMLLAYARRDTPEAGGAIRRASAKVPVVVAPFAHGLIDCFDAKAATAIASHAEKAGSLEALLFELKLDGYTVTEGELKPHAAKWRF